MGVFLLSFMFGGKTEMNQNQATETVTHTETQTEIKGLLNSSNKMIVIVNNYFNNTK